jgi:DNA-directed RNA polymerase sigma subunit (sigma70/sigma32)
MQVLTPCERQVLRLRYGLSEDGREHTLVELGEMLGVSPERVRQVESAAPHKLRKPAMLEFPRFRGRGAVRQRLWGGYVSSRIRLG